MSLAQEFLCSALRFRFRSTRTAALAVSACGLVLSAHAATLCVNTAGSGGCYSTISAAVTAAASHDVINVAPGTYKEQVTITKTLSLISTVKSGAVINA